MVIKKIAYNTAWQVAGKTVTAGTALIYVFLLTRHLGTSGFGGFTTITTYLQFFGIIVDFGLTMIATQMLSIPNAPEKKTFDNIFTLKVISAFFIFGPAVLIAWIATPYSLVIKIGITIASISFFINAVEQVFVGWYQKYLLVPKLVTAEMISRIAILAGMISVVTAGGGLIALMPVLILGSGTYLFFTIYFIKNRYRPELAFDKDVWKEIIKRSYPIALAIIFNLIYLKADTLILSFIKSQGEVGLYGAAFRVLEALVTVPMMYFGLMLPLFTHAWEKGDFILWRSLYQKTFDIASIFIIPLVLGGIVIAKPLMIMIAGMDFLVSADILKILLLALLGITASSLFGYLIVSMNTQKKTIWIYALIAALGLTFYLIFIPRYSFWAAAAITLAAETSVALLTFLAVWKKSKFIPNFKKCVASLIAGIIMLYILNSIDIHFIFKIIVGALIYTAALIILLRKHPKTIIQELVF